MALTDLLKSFTRAVTLGAALYSCGGEEKEGCDTDNDCHGDRICDYETGRCVSKDNNGSNSGNGSGGSQCGNSPVYAKHLWEISGCEVGLHMKDVKRNCRVDMYLSDDDQGVTKILEDECTYQGTELDCDNGLRGEFRSDLRYNGNQAMNDILDEYDGFVLVPTGRDFNPNNQGGNAWIPRNEEFPGHVECAPLFKYTF